MSKESLAKALRKRREENNDMAARIVRYLNEIPAFITKEMIDEIGVEKRFEQGIYRSMFAAAIGLDSENNPEHARLEREYINRGVEWRNRKAYMDDPFFKCIKIDEAHTKNWKLGFIEYKPYEAFVCGEYYFDGILTEVPQIGYFDEPFTFPAVFQNDREWMAIKPNETETMTDDLAKVKGRVVTFGLGIGYFAHNASLKDSVESVTIVERDPEVIELFEKCILPQFAHKEKIRIVESDVIDYVQHKMLPGEFDYVYADIWHDAYDGVDPYFAIKQEEHRFPGTEFLYWIESTLLSNIRFGAFEQIVEMAKTEEELKEMLSFQWIKNNLHRIM